MQMIMVRFIIEATLRLEFCLDLKYREKMVNRDKRASQDGVKIFHTVEILLCSKSFYNSQYKMVSILVRSISHDEKCHDLRLRNSGKIVEKSKNVENLKILITALACFGVNLGCRKRFPFHISQAQQKISTRFSLM